MLKKVFFISALIFNA
jgi:hypothetical protein